MIEVKGHDIKRRITHSPHAMQSILLAVRAYNPQDETIENLRRVARRGRNYCGDCRP